MRSFTFSVILWIAIIYHSKDGILTICKRNFWIIFFLSLVLICPGKAVYADDDDILLYLPAILAGSSSPLRGGTPGWPNDYTVPSGVQFCHEWYLNKYKDVKKDGWFWSRPYEHYVKNGQNEGRVKCPASTTPIDKFIPTYNPVKLLDGHDNGVTTVAANGTVWMATGDGFVGLHKYETAIFKLPLGKNPMVPSNWRFVMGTRGKAYGLLALGNTVYGLISDKGSMYEGSQNVRVWNLNTGWKSNNTLQSQLHASGVNWFFVQNGPNTPKDRVLIGCVQLHTTNYGYDNQGPVEIWRGDLERLQTMQYLGEVQGLPNNKSTVVSITKVDERWVAGVGYWQDSIVYEYVSTGESVMGPYALKRADTFSPPMEREDLGSRISGAFTLNYVNANGWYRVITGHGGADDATWIQRVMRNPW